MVQQVLAVFLVLGLLLGALWLLRKQGLATFNFVAGSKPFAKRRGAPKRMRVIERVVLTPQHSLHLVAVDDRIIVFAASPAGCHAVDASHTNVPGQDTDLSFRNAASTC